MKFGAYEILHELKSGGMGSVLLGRRRGPGAFEQLVAIKTIRSEYASTEAVRAMFLDEAKIVGGINHPVIATVHDFGEEAGTLYMAMEYVAGLSFRSAMELPGGVPPAIAARAVAAACRGLHAAHEVRDPSGHLQGVVHRDVSPDNLLLGFDGQVKVIDFGIALVKNRQSPVTEFGTVKGKPPYMSPEQVKNESLDRRSDVFSLAVVLHELLTGEMLFEGDSIYAIARKVEHMEIPPPSKVIGNLPAGLDAIVMAALERDPAKRTPSAAVFAEQLEQVIGDETLEAWAERTLADERDRHRAWLAEIVAGRDAPRRIGRATGSVTALGPLALVDQLAPTPLPALPKPASVVDEPLDQPRDPPRRRVGVPIAILLLLALVVGVVVTLTRTSKTVVVDAAIADTSSDTAMVIVADAPPDASPDAEVPDAPLDAGRVVTARDAGTPKRVDAAVRDAAVPDAAPAVTGTGKLIVRHHASSKTFLRVLVDNQPWGDTPILPARALSAGPHTITLVEPVNNGIVFQTKVTIADGVTTTVVQPGS